MTKKNLLSSIFLSGIVFTFFAYKYRKHSKKYNTDLPADICHNIHAMKANKATKRIVAALQFNKENTEIKDDSLTKQNLKNLVSSTNSSFFHYSGNCTLLARCVLYNFKKGRSFLAAKNSYPIYLALSTDSGEKILFGKNLVEMKLDSSSVVKLEKQLLDIFNRTGERYFIIAVSNYELPIIGRIEGMGHDFNAVIMGSGNDARVQFIDAWKTSNYTPDRETIAHRCRGGNFSIVYYPGPLQTTEALHQPSSFTY